MADELNREEVSDRLVTIFSASLEGSELEKAIASVDKRLDKFEGKWAGLIKWAEQKYGLPEESGAEEVVEETQEVNGGYTVTSSLTTLVMWAELWLTTI